MVLPLVLGAIAISASAFGVSKGVEGASAMGEAQDKVKRAQERYERRKKRLDSRVSFVNKEANLYGMLQKDVKEAVFLRVAKLIEDIGKKAKVDVYEVLEGFDISIPTVGSSEKHKVKAESVFNGLLVAAGASVLASTATTGGVTMLATASTGAAISGLSGAAANSALLAALGGGSLAAGGGGMALGSLVLGGVTFAPVLAVGGLAVAVEGEKALTKATKIECDANKAIAEMELRESMLDGVVQRINELSRILNELKDRALASLALLEEMVSADQFDGKNTEHMEKLRSLLLVVSSLAQIMKTPVLGENGGINPEIDVVIKQVVA